jgi:predicted Zn-dependent peptidase
MVKILKTEIINDFEKGPVKRSLFSNGTVYLYHHFPGMAGAVVTITFIVGSKDEKESEHGITHVIEHMLFKEGHEGSIIKEIEENGGDINAYTSKEHTTYELSCLGSKLKHLLPLYLQLILDPHFTEEQLAKEKKVILQELREDKDDHESSAHEYLFEKLYNNGLAHPIGGKLKDVKQYSIKDIKKFHKKYFVPERMIIGVAAGEEKPELEKLLCEHLPASSKKSYRLKAKNKLGNVNKIHRRQKKDIKNTILLWGMNGLSIESEYYFDLVVLDSLLCDGMSSVFFKKFRIDRPLMYSLESNLFAFEDNGHYCIGVQTQPKHEKTIISEIKETFAQLETYEFPKTDIEFAKQRILDAYEYSFDSMEERLEFITGRELYGIESFSMQRVREQVSRVSIKRLNTLVKKLRQAGDFSLILDPK